MFDIPMILSVNRNFKGTKSCRKRLSLPPRVLATKRHKVFSFLSRLPFWKSLPLFCFVSLEDQHSKIMKKAALNSSTEPSGQEAAANKTLVTGTPTSIEDASSKLPKILNDNNQDKKQVPQVNHRLDDSPSKNDENGETHHAKQSERRHPDCGHSDASRSSVSNARVANGPLRHQESKTALSTDSSSLSGLLMPAVSLQADLSHYMTVEGLNNALPSRASPSAEMLLEVLDRVLYIVYMDGDDL